MMTYFDPQELKYLRDIGIYSDKLFISNDEMVTLIKSYRDENKSSTMELIIKQCIKLIAFIAKKYNRSDIDVGDLIHAGVEGVIESVNTYYNVDADEKFITYIKIVIERRMKDTIEQYYQTIRLPKNESSRQAQIKGGKASNDKNLPMQYKINLGTIHDYKNLYNSNYLLDEAVEMNDVLTAESLQYDIYRIIDIVLSPIEHQVIVHSFGLKGENSKSLALISEIINMTEQGAGIIKKRAIEKIRNNASCIKILSKY